LVACIGREDCALARAFPLRFVDGAVFLGSLKVGQVPPLF